MNMKQELEQDRNIEIMQPRIGYTGGRLDRAGALRQDPEWVEKMINRDDTEFVPVWRDRHLIGENGQTREPVLMTFRRDAATRILDAAKQTVFLGLESETAYFAVDLSDRNETEIESLSDTGSFQHARKAGPLLAPAEAALMAYARGMLHWNKSCRYCGWCGSLMMDRFGGHLKHCANSDCGRETYPRTDPVVIMLVEHRFPDGVPRCLLGNHKGMPPRSYSTLAGFVEPGESLEGAVAREVLEETGVQISEAKYQASQPWPFPASIMLGFRARAVTTEIKIDPNELAHAGWFTAHQVRTGGEWGDPTAPICRPPKDSISRYLLESWLQDMTVLGL